MAIGAWNKKPCKYGMLKRGAKGGRGRVCRKAPRRKREHARKCKHGMLKNPIGRRVCRRRPATGGMRLLLANNPR